MKPNDFNELRRATVCRFRDTPMRQPVAPVRIDKRPDRAVPLRRKLGAVCVQLVLLGEFFAAGVLYQHMQQTGWPWENRADAPSTYEVTVEELAERLRSVGFDCLLHDETPISDMGLVSAKCDVGKKRFDLTVHVDEDATWDSVRLSNSPLGCTMARLRGARHLAIAAGSHWAVFTTYEEDARTIANELNGFFLIRECRRTGSA